MLRGPGSALRRALPRRSAPGADAAVEVADVVVPELREQPCGAVTALPDGAVHHDRALPDLAVPLAQLVSEVMDGEIVDIKTQAAILKAARLLGI